MRDKMSDKTKRIIYIAISLLCVAVILLFVFLFSRGRNDADAVTIKDTLIDGAGKEATVIILAGQSNASGASRDEYLRKNVTPEKYAEYESGYSNVFINYVAGPKVSGEFVKCGVRQGEIDAGFGPELGIADKLHEAYPERTFFIIKCAWGGSNLYDQWLSPESFGKTGELYKSFVKFVNANLEYLESKNYNAKIEAMCWMQGESDSLSVDNATDYEKHLKNLINDVRKEFKDYASNDGIAFVDALIADNPKLWLHFDLVNQSKRSVCDLSDMNSLIDTVAEGLSCAEEPEEEPDLAHYDSLSEIKLGHLFAVEAIKFFDRK